MAYATTTDLARFGLPAAALSGVSASVQSECLEAASDVADSYLRSRYATPLQSYGSDLTQCVCALAAELILTTRGLDPTRANGDVIIVRADRMRAWLRDVSAGKAAVTGGVTVPGPQRFATATTAPTTTSSSQRGW